MPTVSVNPIGIAVDALRQWLLATLSVRVAANNLQRAAVLTSAAGPFAISTNHHLVLGIDREGAGTSVTLTAGASVTAASIVTSPASLRP